MSTRPIASRTLLRFAAFSSKSFVLALSLCCTSAYAQSAEEIVKQIQDLKNRQQRPPSTPPSSGPQQPSAEAVRRNAEIKRQRDIQWSSEEAADYARRGDWNNAIRSFEEALDRDPDNEDLAKDLANARSEKARALATAAAVSTPVVHLNSAVVDTRGVPKDAADLIARVPQLAQSPAYEPIRKGYQALLLRDWKVALAWWQTALKSDPGNDALIRSIDLAQWMVDRPRRVNNIPPKPFLPAIDAASVRDTAAATHLLKRLRATGSATNAQHAELLLVALRDRTLPTLSNLDPDNVLAGFFIDPMFGSALARIANGDIAEADKIFDRIDANRKADH